MTGNVALDVVIGLVFIYLLYSLYATILMEIVSSLLGLRARNLSYALKRMLMDREKEPSFKIFSLKIPQPNWLSELINSLLQMGGRGMNFTNKDLYTNFNDQPSIKTLSSGGFSNKPSYITAANFSKGLMDALKDDDPDVSVLGKIQAGLENLPEDSETRKQIQGLLEDANNDLTKFKTGLEQWFNDTMERSIGWFKRTTQVFLVAIAAVLVVTFNVNTLAIIEKLSSDKEARDQLVELAISSKDDIQKIVESVKAIPDSTERATTAKEKTDSLTRSRHRLEEDIRKSQNILMTNWNLQDSLMIYKDKPTTTVDSVVLKKVLKNMDSIFVIVHSSIEPRILLSLLPNSITKEIEKKGAKEKITIELTWIDTQKGWYKFYYVLSHIWGYLLTVLALSLGAPFWFDLLNKLIKLRTSKAQTTEAATPLTASGTLSNTPPNANYIG